MLNVFMPANVTLFFKIILELAKFNLIPTDPITDVISPPEVKSDLEMPIYLIENGVEETNVIRGLGPIFLITLLYGCLNCVSNFVVSI